MIATPSPEIIQMLKAIGLGDQKVRDIDVRIRLNEVVTAEVTILPPIEIIKHIAKWGKAIQVKARYEFDGQEWERVK